MKKIFIILSVLSLFVGCASNKVEQQKMNEIISEETVIRSMYAQYKEEFLELLNSSEFSKTDWEKLKSLYGHYMSEKLRSGEEIEFSRLWLEEYLKDKTRKHDNFTGKIINNSDKSLKIGIMSKSDGQTRWFYLEVLPHEEKYFTIPNLVKMHDTYIAFKNPELWYFYKVGEHPNKYINDPDKKINNLWNTYCDFVNYVFDNYSLEFIYDEDIIIKNNYEWRFVPRYENEENMLKEVDYDTELSKLLGTYK